MKQTTANLILSACVTAMLITISYGAVEVSKIQASLQTLIQIRDRPMQMLKSTVVNTSELPILVETERQSGWDDAQHSTAHVNACIAARDS